MSRLLLIVVLSTLLFVSCDPFGSDDGIDSHFNAIISGDITAHLQGRASFGTFTDPVTGLTATIIIMTPSNDSHKGINISGLTVSQIEERSYPIIVHFPGDPFRSINRNEFTASYRHDEDRYSETFQSQIGELSFSSSSESMLQGSFLFDAIGYRISNNDNHSYDTTEVFISIEGNFTSVRGDVI